MSFAKVELQKFSGDPEHWNKWKNKCWSLLQGYQLKKPVRDMMDGVCSIDDHSHCDHCLSEAQVNRQDKEFEKLNQACSVICNSLGGEAEVAASNVDSNVVALMEKLTEEFDQQRKTQRLKSIRELVTKPKGKDQKVAAFCNYKESIFHDRLKGNVTNEELLIASAVGCLPSEYNIKTSSMLVNNDLDYKTAKLELTQFEEGLKGNKESDVAVYQSEGTSSSSSGAKKKFDDAVNRAVQKKVAAVNKAQGVGGPVRLIPSSEYSNGGPARLEASQAFMARNAAEPYGGSWGSGGGSGGKGKGKGKGQLECWTCGGNHKEYECAYKKQLEEEFKKKQKGGKGKGGGKRK